VAKMGPPQDRRQFPRQVSYIVAEYIVKEGTFRDIIKNISAGGLFVWTQRHVAVGQSIMLEFPLFEFEDVIQVSGTVVRSDAKGFEVNFNKPIAELQDNQGRPPKIVHEAER
jgi:Tfp pilus assembly protein PilZ